MLGIIYNPVCGKKNHKQRMEHFLALLKEAGIEYDFRETTGYNDAMVHAEDLSKTCDTIVIGSGDGTIYEALNSLWDKDIDITLLPYGTGNDIYQGVYGTKEFTEEMVLERIKRKNVVKVDCARINDQYTMTLIGAFGFPTQMVVRHKEEGCSYSKTIPGIIAHCKRDHYILRIDGKETDYETEFIGAFNFGIAGGGMRVCNSSSMNDGMMEMIVIKKSSLIRRYLNLLAIIMKRLESQPNVEFYKFKECSMTTTTLKTCNLDGELVDFDEFNIKVIQEKLRFLS